jgi:dienelactone hydrolase
MNYYTSLESMAKRYDDTTREYALLADTQEEYDIWKEQTRKRLCEISGISKCLRVPLTPQKLGSIEEEDYIREYWTIQTEPGVTMPFYLLNPKRKATGAAMIVPHGHGPGKDGTIGNTDNPAVAAHQEWFMKPSFAIELVREGYLVVCPDARGTGDRREFVQQGDTADCCISNSHREILQVSIGFGQSAIGLFTWDLMRLVDFLCDDQRVDKDRIGCAGMSGGGQQTLWLAMLDERIKVAVTSGYFYGMKESLLLLPHNCSCNYVPGIWNTVDMGDMGALIAPRAFLIESGEQDPLNGKSGINNVLPQYETVKRAYRLLHAEDRLQHAVHKGGHVWDGTEVLPFIKKWL